MGRDRSRGSLEHARSSRCAVVVSVVARTLALYAVGLHRLMAVELIPEAAASQISRHLQASPLTLAPRLPRPDGHGHGLLPQSPLPPRRGHARQARLPSVRPCDRGSFAAFLEEAFEQDYLQRPVHGSVAKRKSPPAPSAMVEQLAVGTRVGSFSSERDCFSTSMLAAPK